MTKTNDSSNVIDGWPENVAKWLQVERCIPLAIAKHFGLGWDGFGVTIPIEGWVKRRNLLSYDPISGESSYGENKMVWTVKKEDGVLPPFPSWNELAVGDLIVEGEFDAICAIAHGFMAVSGTAGSGSWNVEWSDATMGRVYTILYDNDRAGENGAIKVAESLLSRGAPTVKIAKWPVDCPPGWDVTEHFRSGGTPEELQQIINAAEAYVRRGPVRKGRVLGGIEL
ncbi:MAG TPA: toprim domain-containing protein [Patescibacteria group bacterium]|nr:toprim domain-containing protein [Patescibacteria group bacterium]